jgi:hypothetical protein
MVMDKLLRMGEGRKAKQTQKIVDEVNAAAADLAAYAGAATQATRGIGHGTDVLQAGLGPVRYQDLQRLFGRRVPERQR